RTIGPCAVRRCRQPDRPETRSGTASPDPRAGAPDGKRTSHRRENSAGPPSGTIPRLAAISVYPGPRELARADALPPNSQYRAIGRRAAPILPGSAASARQDAASGRATAEGTAGPWHPAPTADPALPPRHAVTAPRTSATAT